MVRAAMELLVRQFSSKVKLLLWPLEAFKVVFSPLAEGKLPVSKAIMASITRSAIKSSYQGVRL